MEKTTADDNIPGGDMPRGDSIYDLDAMETLHSVEKSLHGLADLLYEQTYENMSPQGLRNVGEMVRIIADMQTHARIDLQNQFKQKTQNK